MNPSGFALLLAFVAICLTGCTTHRASPELRLAGRGSDASQVAEAPGSDRLLIWRAQMAMVVSDVDRAVEDAVVVGRKFGGFVQERRSDGENSATVVLRIPAERLMEAMSDLEGMGRIKSHRLSSEDVTEAYVDTEARLKTRRLLRDRLQKLLEQTHNVRDILDVERELNRVQGEIDQLEARLASLSGQIDYAHLTLTIERSRIYGPLGYAFKGLFWAVEKLFVIR